MIRALFGRLDRRSRFGADVAMLTAGGLSAQVVVIAASPVLSRLYEPEEIAILGLLATIVSMGSPILCGRYDVALLMPRSRDAAERLLGIALRFTVAIAAIAFLTSLIAGDRIALALDAPTPRGWILLVAPALLLTGVGIALSGMASRLRRFAVIARARFAQSTVAVVLNLSLGALGAGSIGLLSAYLAGLLASASMLAHRQPGSIATVLRWDLRSTTLMRRYRSYPLVNASSGLLHGVTLALPMLVLAAHFPIALVGQFALLMRVATLPLNALSDAVSRVHLRRVVDLVASGESIRGHLVKVMMLMAAFAAIPTLVLTLHASTLFAWVFGESWRPAGEFLQIMMPAIAVRFVVGSISTTFGGTSNNGLVMIWRLVALAVTSTVLAWGAATHDPSSFFRYFAMSEIALYALMLGFAWRAAGHPRSTSRPRPSRPEGSS